MSKVNKKKVSFDIDPKVLSDIKEFCESRNMKVADFYREAVEEKLANDSGMIIYVPMNGVIEKISIDPKYYDIDIWEASDKMKENVGAVNEGVLRLNDDFDFDENQKAAIERGEMNPLEIYDPRIIGPLIYDEDQQKIYFYTLKRYG